MIGIKTSRNFVPFPAEPGYYVRLCFKDNNMVQGQVLWFRGEEVVDMSQGGVATPEVVQEGDARCAKDSILATYTKIEGISMRRPANDTNGSPPPSTTPSPGIIQ